MIFEMVVVTAGIGEAIQTVCLNDPFGPMILIVALTTAKTCEDASCCAAPYMFPESQTSTWTSTVDTRSGTLHKIDCAAVDGRDHSES